MALSGHGDGRGELVVWNILEEIFWWKGVEGFEEWRMM